MRRTAGLKDRDFSLSSIATRQPSSGAAYAVLALGGVSLYGPSSELLEAAVLRVQTAIEEVLAGQVLVVRNQVEKLARVLLGEEINDRVLAAVFGRSLRLGATHVLPCLTVNARVLRLYHHRNNAPAIQRSLRVLNAALKANTAVSVDAAQLACFPDRGWGTKFLAKQLLAHLAYRGVAVYVDDDLFASPLSAIQDALHHRLK